MVDLPSRVCLSKKGFLEKKKWDKFWEQKGWKIDANVTSLHRYEARL
jgi:hypothetical protein